MREALSTVLKAPGRSGPIRRLVSPGGRSAFHGLQVPPTTGNLANPVTDSFQYIQFDYSMQTIGHLFTYSLQSIIRPKKKPSARGNAPKAVVTTGQLWQFPIYHPTDRFAKRRYEKAFPVKRWICTKKKGKHPTGKTVGDSVNLALIIVHRQPDHMKKPRGAAESEEQRHHGSDCLKSPSSKYHTPIIRPYKITPSVVSLNHGEGHGTTGGYDQSHSVWTIVPPTIRPWTSAHKGSPP